MRNLRIPLLLVASLLVTGCAMGSKNEVPPAAPQVTAAGDADKDGVPDSSDRCPKSPKGQVVDEHGCPFDSDGDGVPDARDSCPNTPIGVDVDARGCPTDSDNDGVADYKDRCPSTPFGQAVDQWGCSKTGEMLAVLENVNFDFDKATLRSDARATLGQVADTLRNNPTIGVNIVGHTDATGPDSYNMSLSMQRARAVRDFLTQAGIGGHRMGVEGKGESQPVASNGSSAGRARNRRVEFVVTSK